MAQTVWQALVDEALRLIREYHQQHPLRGGLSREEWRARLRLAPRLAAEVFHTLQAEGRLVEAETASALIRLPGFTPTFTAEQERAVQRLLQHFRDQPYAPPTRAEAEALAGPEIVGALIEQGRLVRVGEQTLFLHEAYQQAVARIRAYLQEHGTITVAQARDLLGTTRKYVLPLLEHLDEQHITRRSGDERMLLHQPAGA